MEYITNNTKQILININFDIDFYKSHYDDLTNMGPIDLINHYIQHGRNEGRIVSNKHVSIITHNPNFDIDFYKSNYPDLQHLSWYDLVLHYKLFGKNEGRYTNKSDLCIDFCKNNPDFDIDFYKSSYTDLQHLCDHDLVLHYKLFGKNEGRIFKEYLQEPLVLYNQYRGNVEFKESIYLKSFPRTIYNLLDELEKDDIKILITSGGYVESSGGLSVLHYFCHLLNYIAKKNVAFLVPLRNKPISQYTIYDCKLVTNPNFITPCVTLEILLTRNNIVVYMESVDGNPLEQKHVVRWILYFEESKFIKTWNPSDLIMWYIDTYKKYSKNVQKINNEMPIQADEITNQQIICHIISHVKEILNMGNTITNKKKGVCYTTRKAGNNFNTGRKLVLHENENNNVCNNCQKQIWPSLCYCKYHVNGVKLVHQGKLVYRFESSVNISTQIELFKNTNRFYMYDPFCFSAVIAGLNNCLTIIPKLAIFEQNNIFENVPWMKYGISYGNDIESIQKAEQTLPNVKENIERILFDINYDNIMVFLTALEKMIYK